MRQIDTLQAMRFARLKRDSPAVPEMFVEIDEDGKIAPTATPIPEREVWARLRREGAADPTIKAAVLDAREREVA